MGSARIDKFSKNKGSLVDLRTVSDLIKSAFYSAANAASEVPVCESLMAFDSLRDLQIIDNAYSVAESFFKGLFGIKSMLA